MNELRWLGWGLWFGLIVSIFLNDSLYNHSPVVFGTIVCCAILALVFFTLANIKEEQK